MKLYKEQAIELWGDDFFKEVMQKSEALAASYRDPGLVSVNLVLAVAIGMLKKQIENLQASPAKEMGYWKKDELR